MTTDERLTAERAGDREEVIGEVTAALAAEGFGILTRIDLDGAFREKLGTAFRPYTILGACNPSLAYRALSARSDVGLLLPCNVTVDEHEPGRARITIVDPMEMLGSLSEVDGGDLSDVARDARTRLERVAEALAQT